MNDDWRNELITKGAAFDALTEIENQYEFKDGHDHLMSWAKTKIFALPSAQPQRMRGEWIEDGYNHYKAVCSECGEPCATYVMGKPRDNFCKWCGADMRGEQDG